MEPTTLYYFFSTVAQVMAAISALLAIFTQFKLSELNAFLIGDGMATYKRMSDEDEGYQLTDTLEHKAHLDRLRDALSRRSILGILKVIDILAINEGNQGKNETTNPRGLQYLKRRFEERILRIVKIKSLIKTSIIIAFTAIIISLISLAIVQNIKNKPCVVGILIVLILILSILSIAYTIWGVYKGLESEDDV